MKKYKKCEAYFLCLKVLEVIITKNGTLKFKKAAKNVS
jgi:hypothetical protein